ncbi:MAG TPA: lysylphosphatidylglycerol synthase transmembrane domain-containing protein [Vicinamibacterales bacterium]|nr:lysylphosphatidylglycerol synthase transmembrane domain-containing protein [Vicinamibacterales bacterium]
MSPGTFVPRTGFRLSAGLRLTFAVALLAYLLVKAEPLAVARVFATVRWPPLVLVTALVLIDRALMARRWFVLLRPLDRERLPSFGAILRIFFVSTFVGTFLPASIGGDAVRAYSLSNHGVPLAAASASVFVDRMLGVLSLFLMALLGLSLADGLASDRAIQVGLAATGLACAIASVLIFSSAAETMAEKLLGRVTWNWVRRAPLSVLAALRRYGQHRGALWNVLAASVAVQVLRILQAYYLGAAIGLSVPLMAYFAFVPLIMLVMLLPVTVNGIGTSQAAFIWFFSRVGTTGHEAFALSVLFVALQVVGNIPGAVFVIAGTFSGRRCDVRSPK